ncbi:transmembrane protein 179-like [Dicentrarchus labrax]|uniref:transmembrane protein 179-like n=1 Tax=Dicentrarchus labrax TaxID=13489 RepID=UPI0021F5587A|nr:transmembrane protein 179-like [Dicentrarchus labrax]
MELDRRLLLAHCAAHALSVVAGLLVVVPMALNGSAFKGRCALFSTGYWRTENRAELTGQPGDVSHLVVQQWGPPAACQFSTFVGIFTVLYGAAQGWRYLFYLHGRHDDTLFSSFLTVLLSVCVLFLSGGASVILSLGLVSWCDTVTDDNTRPYSCAESQSVPLYLDVDTSSFYTELGLAQVSLWCVTALWLAQSILAFLRLYHSHSQHINVPCRPREKELLLGHSPCDSGSPSPAPATPTLLV